MGQPIDRAGTFRGIDVNRGISESSGGHTQWVADLVATEYYDEDTQQWVDWSEYDVNEIRCWLMLFDKDTSKKPYLNSKQLQKAGRWSGLSFQELKQDPPESLLFQFRVEPNDYKDDGSFKVTWVDHYDAEPGRAMNALDDDAVKSLNIFELISLVLRESKILCIIYCMMFHPVNGFLYTCLEFSLSDRFLLHH